MVNIGDSIQFIGNDKKYYFGGNYTAGKSYVIQGITNNFYYAWGSYSERAWIHLTDDEGQDTMFPVLERDRRAFHKNWR